MLHACGLAQACVLIGDERRAELLYDQLAPFADRNAISISTLAFGPVSMRLGSISALLGRWEQAEGHFDDAAERCDALGARAISAMLLIERARMFLGRAGRGDVERARVSLDASLTISDDLGLPGIADRARAIAPGRAQRPVGVGAQRDDETTAGPSLFRREGQYWTVRHQGEMARLPDRKGMRYLGELLRAPGREVHVLELMGVAEPVAPHPAEPGFDGAGGEAEEAILDPRAKREFRQRLLELEGDLDEAESRHDIERASTIKAEIDAIAHELASAAGLGGRDRHMPSPAERARVSVTKAIRGAVRAIATDCPQLGLHLEASVRTGRLCSYAPPGEAAPDWQR